MAGLNSKSKFGKETTVSNLSHATGDLTKLLTLSVPSPGQLTLRSLNFDLDFFFGARSIGVLQQYDDTRNQPRSVNSTCFVLHKTSGPHHYIKWEGWLRVPHNQFLGNHALLHLITRPPFPHTHLFCLTKLTWPSLIPSRLTQPVLRYLLVIHPSQESQITSSTVLLAR